MPRRRSRDPLSDGPLARAGDLYLRVSAAFILGLYLPAAATAPDLPRHFVEALHHWAILCLAPIAACRLVRQAIAGSIAAAERADGRSSRHRFDRRPWR